MKKILFGLLLLAILFTSCMDVNPGYVAVRVWKRGDKAGEIDILNVGRHGKSMKSTDFIFPTYNQNYVWTADRAEGSPNDESMTFPIEGLQINVDVGIEFSVDKENVGIIFSEYRKDLEGITDGPIRNFVRDAILSEVQNYNDMEQFISNNEISKLFKDIETKVKDYFINKGIIVSKLYLINSPRYPQSVTDSIEEKIKATQKAMQRENELREAEAEAKKKIAEAEGTAQSRLTLAKSEAEANRLKQASYTTNILKAMWIEKWDGKLPETMLDQDSSLMVNP